jgi:hypothetical protein
MATAARGTGHTGMTVEKVRAAARHARMTARWHRALFDAYVGRELCECEGGEEHLRRSAGGAEERRCG